MMQIVALNSVVQFQGGSQPPKAEWISVKSEGYIPMLQIRDFTQGPKNEYVKFSNSLKTCEADDILIARYGASVGKILTGLSGAYNVAIMKATPKNNVLDKRYMYYFFKSNYFQTKITTVGSRAAQQGFNKEDLSTIQIPLPPLSEQKRIVAILDKAQQLIDLRRQQLAKLDELIQSIFYDMFGDPVTNPKGWEVNIGQNFSELITVGVVIKPASYYVDEGVIALRSLNVKPNYIDLSNIVYFSKVDHKNKLSKSILKVGDVVIVRTGITGTASVIPKELDGINCIDLIIVRTKKNIINPIYLSYFLNSDRGKYLVSNNEVGGIQKHFNVGSFKKIRIPTPPITLQNQFAAKVEKIEEQKKILQQSLAKLEENFKALQQRAFRGHL